MEKRRDGPRLWERDGSFGGEQITSTRRNHKPKKRCSGPIRGKGEKAVARRRKRKTKEIPQTGKLARWEASTTQLLVTAQAASADMAATSIFCL